MPAPDYSAEIAQLRTALASGEAEIRNADGSMMRLRSVSEIQQAIAHFNALAQASAGGSAPGRTTYASFERR